MLRRNHYTVLSPLTNQTWSLMYATHASYENSSKSHHYPFHQFLKHRFDFQTGANVFSFAIMSDRFSHISSLELGNSYDSVYFPAVERKFTKTSLSSKLVTCPTYQLSSYSAATQSPTSSRSGIRKHKQCYPESIPVCGQAST